MKLPVWSLLSVVLLLGAFFGCASSSDVITQVGTDPLRAFATAAKAAESGASEVAKNLWPPALATGSVKAVRYYIDGILIVTAETDRETSGVFVGWNDDQPYDGSGITFERVDARIYRFVEKRRVAAGATRP